MRTALERFNHERSQLAAKTQRDQAAWFGVSPVYLNCMIHGKNRLSARVLRHFANGKSILLQQAKEIAEREWEEASA